MSIRAEVGPAVFAATLLFGASYGFAGPLVTPPTSISNFIAASRAGDPQCPGSNAGLIVHNAKVCQFTKNSLGPLPPYDKKVATLDGGPAKGAQPVDLKKIQKALRHAFAYYPPGRLHSSSRRRGRTDDRRVYLPDIVYPLRLGAGLHPHMNSQIYGFGGGGWGGRGRAGGRECDPRNYDPQIQTDNYCEARGWKMPLCPSGTGHQGQDIRPPTCVDSRWDVVAVVDGIITRVTRNTTVVLKGEDGTSYSYLHMNPNTITVQRGDRVGQGQVLGKISKFMGGRRSTTVHLHFHARQTLRIGQRSVSTYVPVYTSLINAYRRAKGLGNSIDAQGNLIRDATFEIGIKKTSQPPASKPLPPTNPTPPKLSSLEQSQPKPPPASNVDRVTKALATLKSKLAALRKELAESDGQVRKLDHRLTVVLNRAQRLEGELERHKRAAAQDVRELRAELARLRAEQKGNLLPRVKTWWQSLGWFKSGKRDDSASSVGSQ